MIYTGAVQAGLRRSRAWTLILATTLVAAACAQPADQVTVQAPAGAAGVAVMEPLPPVSEVVYLSQFHYAHNDQITSSLRSAIAHLSSVGGGRLIIERSANGTWYAANVKVPKNISIEGLPGATIKLSDPTTFASIFEVDDAENVTISGLTLDGGFDHEANPGPNQVTWFGIRVNDSTDVTITDNIILNSEHGAIALFATDRSRIHSNTLIDSSRHPSGANVWLFGSSDNEVSGNRITSDQGGIGVLIDDSSTGLSPRAGIASNNRVFDNDIQIRSRDGQARPSATGIAIETGYGNRIYDNRIVAHWIGIQVQSGLTGTPIGDWGPTQATYIADNEVRGEGIGLLGIQSEKGADSTSVIGGLVDGFAVAGIRYQFQAKAGDPPVNGVELRGDDVVVGTVLIDNRRALVGLSESSPNVEVTIIE